jgi:RHS repeat-associated protein
MAKAGEQTGATSPPAGTGYVPGLGEAFNINLSTGQGMYSYRLPLPDGVAGHTPRLSLEYSHGAGLSVWGCGWRLPVRSISRRLDFGVPDDGVVERFMDSGAEIVPTADGTFRALIETTFTRYTRQGDGWRIEERDGIVHEVGLTSAARIADAAHPARIHEWLVERSLDPSGNAITYRYVVDEGIPYLSEIRYAAYALRCFYEERPDVRSDGRLGFLRRRTKRGTEVALFLDPGPGERRIRSWTFTYQTQPVSGMSMLAAIQMVSHGPAADGSQDVRRPATRFQYTAFAPQQYAVQWMESPDGPPPPALNEAGVALLTLDNAPLPGILQMHNGRQYYWRNQGNGQWGAPQPLQRTPEISAFATPGVLFVDMDASGTADLMVQSVSPLHGYYENGGSQGWNRFVAFPRHRRTTPPWTSGRVRLTDSDGNGQIDALMSTERAFAVWLNQGEQGWAAPLLVPKGTTDGLPDVHFDDPTVHLADMTGDGLQDIVRVRSGRIEYWPSLGRGRYGSAVVIRNSPRLRDLQRDPQGVFLIDVDGDGCADLVRVSAVGVEVFLNQNGTAFASGVLLDTVPPPIPGTVRPVNMQGRTGSGLLWNSYRGRQVGYVYVDLSPTTIPYLLTRIDNGSGLVSEIQYRSAVEDLQRDQKQGEFWQTNFPFPYMVVASTRETDQVSGQVTAISYRYHEAHYEPHARQFQGFRRTERLEQGDESRATTRTVFHFLMGQERLPGNGPEHAALNGMLRRTEVYGLDGSAVEDRPYRIEESTYDLQVLDTLPDGRQRPFVFVTAHRIEDSERTEDVRGEEKTYTYDHVGNVIRERRRGYGRRGGVAQPEKISTRDIAYAASTTHYILNKPSRAVTRDAAGTILAEQRCYYDGPDFQGLPFGQAERGLLTREEQLVLPAADFNAHYAGMNTTALGYITTLDADGAPAVLVQAARHAYDGRGLRVADRDPLGNTTTYEYDASGLFRTTLINALGETRFAYDRATGQPVRMTYADGTQTRYAYDAQGRVLATALPDEDINNPPHTFTYDDAAIPNSRTSRFRHANVPAATTVAVIYFDGRGKEFQQRAETDAGLFVVSGLCLKNPWGNVKQEYEPTFANNAAFAIPPTAGRPRREIYYDARGRMIKTVNYNNGVATAVYRPFEVITYDANDTDSSPENVARGQFDTPRREEFDVLRHQTSVVEILGGGATATTTYRSNVQGELLAVEDSRGTMCTYSYDRLGNRLVIQHRDAGTRRLWYEARRKVVRTLDANGNDVRAEIDALGRLVRLRAGANVLEEYRYDLPAQQALGRLAEVTYTGGQQTFNYDAAGRLKTHTYRFVGMANPHTLTYDYDLLGREVAVTHPDGTRISKELTPNGWVKAIPGVLDSVTYDARGLPVKRNYHNGVQTETTYTPGPGRVKTQKTLGPLGQVLEDITYEYDRMEMLLSSNDTAPGGPGRRAFAYDPFYQLKASTASEAGAPVTQRYEYSDHYNLSRFDEQNRQLHYDDPLHPDRLVGLTPGGGARLNLNYDGNGNLLTLPGKTLHYNAKNELDRLTAASGLVAEYRYDHQGMRVSKLVNDGDGGTVQTFFVGDLAEIRHNQPAYFVRLGHLRVGLIDHGNTRYVHSDYLGSSAFFSDHTGTKIASIAYRPFGNVAARAGTVDLRTFSIHPFDAESGFYYMRRRYYAPEIGRFITPDALAIYQPTTYLHNPKALHPYIYVANDPLNKVDLTGLSFWSVVGAIVGVIAAVALVVATAGLAAVFGVAGVLMGIVLGIGVVAVSYAVADATAGSDFGEFMRGFMIGMNAGLNAVLASAVFGPVIGITLGVINFLAAVDSIANSEVYQGILGWASWLMPMSWLATAVGLIFFVLNVIPALFTLNQVEAVKIESLSIDWKTGTIIMEGGWTFLPGFRGGFNLGNFAYITPGSTVQEHETGHTLSNAAFGSIFHFIGAIDENILRSNPADAYAERIAESNDPTTTDPDIIPMWV